MNPKPPIHMSKDAKKKFKELAELYDLTQMEAYDLACAYAEHVAMLAEATKEIQKTGLVITASSGAMYQSPAVGIRNKSTKLLYELQKKMEPYKRKGSEDLEL